MQLEKEMKNDSKTLYLNNWKNGTLTKRAARKKASEEVFH